MRPASEPIETIRPYRRSTILSRTARTLLMKPQTSIAISRSHSARGFSMKRRSIVQPARVGRERFDPLAGAGDERQTCSPAAGKETGRMRVRIHCLGGRHAKIQRPSVGPDHMHLVAGAKQIQASEHRWLAGQPEMPV